MRDETMTRWRAADARLERAAAYRKCIVALAAEREEDASEAVAGWDDVITNAESEKRECEAEVGKEIDGDPDAWLYDALR